MDVKPADPQDPDTLHHLEEEHFEYSRQLESLLAKPYLSEEDRLEEVRLKKLKLHIKDKISGLRVVGQAAATPA